MHCCTTSIVILIFGRRNQSQKDQNAGKWYLNVRPDQCMLITFERVWGVGIFDVGRRCFGVPQQPREATVTYRRSLLASPG